MLLKSIHNRVKCFDTSRFEIKRLRRFDVFYSHIYLYICIYGYKMSQFKIVIDLL